jgi:hypothetical protein
MNLSLSIDLTSLSNAQVQNAQDGTAVLIIPIQQNDLFVSERGRVYLTVDAWENRMGQDQYGNTHEVKQHYSQAKRATLPQGVYPPKVGKGKVILTKAEREAQNAASAGYKQTTGPAGYVPATEPRMQYSQPQQQQPQNNDMPF